MRQTKRRLETFSFYDRTHIQRHLEAMAERGWLLERMESFWWVYRRIEPKHLAFQVSYFPDASAFDPGPTQDQLTFQDFCERTGWRFTCSSAQMQVFYNEGPDPLPIETDPALELEIIHQAAKRSFLPGHLVLLLVGLLQGGMFLTGLLSDPVGTLASATDLCIGLTWTMLMVLCLHEILGYLLWRRRALLAAEEGGFLDTPGTAWVQRAILAVVLAAFAWWVLGGSPLLRWTAAAMVGGYIVLFALVDAVKRYLKGRGASRGTTRSLTIGAAFLLAFLITGAATWGLFRAHSGGLIPAEKEAELDCPLVLEDLTGAPLAKDDLLMYTDSRSPVLERIEVRHRGDLADSGQSMRLEYTVTVVKLPALYDWCREQILGAIKEWWPGDIYQPQDPAPWGAAAAYELTDGQASAPTGQYVLCYGDRIVELTLSWDPTAEQMAAVGEAFRA